LGFTLHDDNVVIAPRSRISLRVYHLLLGLIWMTPQLNNLCLNRR
jgi:hypothetical protein